eukprot:427395_1
MWSLSLSISLSKAAAFKSWFVLFIFMLALLAMMSSIISYIAAFDASNTSKTKKLMLSIFPALVWTFVAVSFQFFDAFMLQLFPREQWYTIKMKSAFGMNTISTLSLWTSSTKIMAIFFWKQSYYSYKTWKSKGIKAVA